MTNNANLGIGLATGMAFWAPLGTALPAYPGAELSSDWTEIGAVAESGISYTPARDLTPLKNWSKEIERLLTSDSEGTVESPLLYTVEETLKLLFSESAVTVTAATSEHGKVVSVNIDPNVVPEGRAFLFLMKDGDDLMMLGTSRGFITSVGSVSFSPSDAITWTPTISAKVWTFAKNDGQTV